MSTAYGSFVSYSSHDADLLDRVAQLLEISGDKVFVAKNVIKPGELWKQTLREALGNAQRMVLLWCCHSGESPWVAAEIQAAVEQAKPIVPILLCGEPVPEAVQQYQWIDFQGRFLHSCAHPHSKVKLETVDPRSLMPISIPPEPPKPLLREFSTGLQGPHMGYTQLSPSQYLDELFEFNPHALAVIRAMTPAAIDISGAVFRAIELQKLRGDRFAPKAAPQ